MGSHPALAHLAKRYVVGVPQNNTTHSVHTTDESAQAGADRFPGAFVREILVNPQWDEDDAVERIDGDMDLPRRDANDPSLAKALGVADDEPLTLHLSLNLTEENLTALQEAFPRAILATSRGPALRDVEVTGLARELQLTALQRSIRNLYRQDVLAQMHRGWIAEVTDAGTRLDSHMTLFSCRVCLDVFQDMTCFNDRGLCAYCCDCDN